MYSEVNVLYPKRAFKTGTPVASQSLAVSTAAVAPTGYTPDTDSGGVVMVTFDIQGANMRCRWDGTDPTSTVGHLLFAGTNYTWAVGMYNAAKFIRDTAAVADGVVFASPVSN